MVKLRQVCKDNKGKNLCVIIQFDKIMRSNDSICTVRNRCTVRNSFKKHIKKSQFHLGIQN